jgi:hypothetical protein
MKGDGVGWVEHGGASCGVEACCRLVVWLVGQGEGVPVNAEDLRGSEVEGDLQGFFGVGVLGAHEPSWLIGPDGQDGHGWSTEALANFLED